MKIKYDNRIERLHLLFNEKNRVVSTFDLNDEHHSGLAISLEIKRFITQKLKNVQRVEGDISTLWETIKIERAEWWQDFNYGIQYLMDVSYEMENQKYLQHIRIVDDRRHQLKVI